MARLEREGWTLKVGTTARAAEVVAGEVGAKRGREEEVSEEEEEEEENDGSDELRKESIAS